MNLEKNKLVKLKLFEPQNMASFTNLPLASSESNKSFNGLKYLSLDEPSSKKSTVTTQGGGIGSPTPGQNLFNNQ
jgi:hypothetical protein